MAALLVFYSHIAEQWVAKREVGPTPVIDAIDSVSSDAMHMGAQGIGQIGVPFFFLVSGFVVTPIAMRMGQRRFTVNRLIRVYVPMFFVVLLTALAMWLGVEPLTGNRPELSWWTVLTNMLVINYVIVPQVALVGVAWTLIVELIFYALLVLLLPVLRRWVWLAIAVQLTLVFVVLMSARQFGPSWFLFAVNFSYLPIPILGMIVWATTAKRIPLWLGGVLASLAWVLYVFADEPSLGRLDRSYSLALACAVLFFLMGMFAEPRLKERKVWVALSERSYSIYLLHGLVAFATLDLLRPAVPLALAIPVAVAATFGAVEVSYRFVERPSHVLARRLSRPRPAPPEPEEVVREVERGLAELRAEQSARPAADEDSVDWPEAEEAPAEVEETRVEPPPVAPPPLPPRRRLAARPVRTPVDEVPAERTEEIQRPQPRVPTVEHPTQVIDAVVEQPEPRRRRHNDGTAAVTVQSLLAERAREGRDRDRR
ncbi:acyltransferase family protein [Saccharothrix sp. CCNWYY140]|uniref:acyltransferase family protein n=1 Tax=unclassified Saccharothrix TaxID=2593673 RepID=UPI003FCF49B5